jgi:hypothetical protein
MREAKCPEELTDFQNRYRWNGLTGEKEEHWEESRVVIGDKGTDLIAMTGKYTFQCMTKNWHPTLLLMRGAFLMISFSFSHPKFLGIFRPIADHYRLIGS